MISPPSLETSEIRDRINWFITLRWFAILGVISAVVFSNHVLNINLPTFQLSLTIFLLALFNTLFFLYSKIYFQKRINVIGIIPASIKFANLQIISDLFILTMLIHFSGGIENPFSFYFIFHILISSILLSVRSAYYQATLAIFLLSAMAFLELYGIIQHHPLEKFMLAPLYNNIYYCGGTLFVFSTTMYLSVYMATSITTKLRKRQKVIITLKDELQERNEALQEIQQFLLKSEKLAAVGRLATGVAHQLNNPLTTILTFSQLTHKKTIDENIKNKLEVIISETTRCRNIIKDLLNFAGKSEPKFEVGKINELVENALSFARTVENYSRIKIIKNLSNDLPEIPVDPNQIIECFLNIITNAIESMPEVGALEIITRFSENKMFVVVEIADTGYGISEENLEKIFDPFFTTKGSGSTGLGLAITHKVIEKHNGRIEVESKPNEGSTFKVFLPLKEER